MKKGDGGKRLRLTVSCNIVCTFVILKVKNMCECTQYVSCNAESRLYKYRECADAVNWLGAPPAQTLVIHNFTERSINPINSLDTLLTLIHLLNFKLSHVPLVCSYILHHRLLVSKEKFAGGHRAITSILVPNVTAVLEPTAS